ncbi:MAG: ABC transporter substrate-binding protein [Candidatus Heimdallarchaeota archaeon]|nr:ABC transporter substrate-binding protein [Candidatus Heimdallarchaeota archaeon]
MARKLLIILLLCSLIPAQGLIQSNQLQEKRVVYAMPYGFYNEFSQYYMGSYPTSQWLSSVSAGLLSRNIDTGRVYDLELAAQKVINGLTYTFVLKSGLKFSDGSTLTANDVKFTYTALLSPAINTASYSFYARYFASNDSIVVVDTQTISFTLTFSYAFADTLFDAAIQPEAYFLPRMQAANFNWNNPDMSDSISAGPFMMEHFDSTNQEVHVIRNEHYWNAANVKLDRIIYKSIPERTAAISALADGDVDIFDAQYVASKNELAGLSNIIEDYVAAPSHQELSFNHNHPFLGTGENLPIPGLESGKSVRKAISHIINRDYCANDILEGMGLPASTIVPSVSIGWDETIAYREYSINTAKSYMEAAGFDYTGKPSDWEATELDNFFSITVLSPYTNPARNQWSALIAQTLPKIGIYVDAHISTGWEDIIPRTWGQVDPAPSYNEGGFDIMFVGYGWDLDFDPTGLYESNSIIPNGDNFYGFNQSEYDDLLDAYVTELDFESRMIAFKDLQAYMYEWEIVAPIVYPQDHWAYSSSLSGYDSILLSVSACEWDRLDTTILYTPPSDNYPVVESPGDMTIYEGDDISLVWNISDDNPSHFEIYRDQTTLRQGTWVNGSISVDLSDLMIGTYVFTLMLWDLDDHTYNDTLIVTVLEKIIILPVINSPEDIYLVEGDAAEIVWIGYDDNPDIFEIWNGNTLEIYGSWENETEIVFDLSEFPAGTYKFTIKLFDEDEHSVEDSVYVTIEAVESSETQSISETPSNTDNQTEASNNGLTQPNPLPISIWPILLSLVLIPISRRKQ